jgi:hypothetical protein
MKENICEKHQWRRHQLAMAMAKSGGGGNENGVAKAKISKGVSSSMLKT